MAFTNWLMAHGTSAKVQDQGAVGNLGYYGWGLDFNILSSGSSVWVHVPVPTAMLGTCSRSIRIYFTTGSEVQISQVDVWNGGAKVAEFKNLNLKQGPYVELELNPPIFFESGMGLSVLVNALMDPDSTYGNRRFILNGAGALFEQS